MMKPDYDLDTLFDKQEIGNNIYLLNAQEQVLLAWTFLRFQEHYESPQFRGKIFSHEEFARWYIAAEGVEKNKGFFRYCTKWTGFNIPGEVLEAFHEGEFPKITPEEQWFLDNFEDLRGEEFYIIGTFGSIRPSTFIHEVGHGLYRTSQEYRRDVEEILADLPADDEAKIHQYLGESNGYHPEVFRDETHAYLLAGLGKVLAHSNVDRGVARFIHKRLKTTWGKHFHRLALHKPEHLDLGDYLREDEARDQQRH